MCSDLAVTVRCAVFSVKEHAPGPLRYLGLVSSFGRPGRNERLLRVYIWTCHPGSGGTACAHLDILIQRHHLPP